MFSIILLSNFSGIILDIFIDPNYCDIFLTDFFFFLISKKDVYIKSYLMQSA